MLSNRHLEPCKCFSLISGQKFGEMKILRSFKLLRSFPKIVMHFFFWAVYNCNVGIKPLEEKDCKQSLTQFMTLSLSDTR